MHSSLSSKNVQRIGRKRKHTSRRNITVLPCLDRVGYATKALAMEAINRMNKVKTAGFVNGFRAQKCAECGQWHIGN